MDDSIDEKHLTKITGVISILALVLLMFSAAKQFGYYQYFNLNIFSYLEITELLPQSLFSFFQLIWYWLLSVLISTYFNRKLYAAEKRNSTIIQLPQIKSPKAIFLRVKAIKAIFVSMGIYIVIIVAILIYKYDDIINDKSGTYFAYRLDKICFQIGMIATLSLITVFIFGLYNFKNWLVTMLTPISLALILSGYFSGNFEFNEVKYKHTHLKYIIKIDNKVIPTNKSYYYIGKTRSSVFFYNEKTDLVTIYPSDKVTSMTLGVE